MKNNISGEVYTANESKQEMLLMEVEDDLSDALARQRYKEVHIKIMNILEEF